jgi:hypothetical protein
MTGTDTGVGTIEQEAVGADRLIPVVLDDRRLAEKKCQSKRQKSGIREMDNVG